MSHSDRCRSTSEFRQLFINVHRAVLFQSVSFYSFNKQSVRNSVCIDCTTAILPNRSPSIETDVGHTFRHVHGQSESDSQRADEQHMIVRWPQGAYLYTCTMLKTRDSASRQRICYLFVLEDETRARRSDRQRSEDLTSCCVRCMSDWIELILVIRSVYRGKSTVVFRMIF